MRTLLLSSLYAIVLLASPVPGFNRATPPLTSAGTTVGIRAATTAHSGYMTTAQVFALNAVSSGGAVSDPLKVAHWASTTGEETIGGPINLVVSGTAGLASRIIPTGPAAVFGDPFSQRPNGVLLGQTIPIGGGAWTGKSGGGSETDTNNFAIVSGYAVANPPAAGGVGALLIGNSANADGCLSVVYKAYAGGGTYSGPVFRSNAAGTNFWNLQIGGGHFYLARYDASTPWSATIVNDTPEIFASGDTASVCFSGTTITDYHNGVQIASITNATYQTNTYSGLVDFYDDAGSNHFQDLIQTTTVTPGLTITVANGGALTLPKFRTAQQFTSTAPPGTAPIILASNTLVTNLNADLLDGLDSTAFATSTAVAAKRGYLTLVGFLGVSNGSSDSGKLTVDTNAITPKTCTVELESLGVGAGTCVYSLYDTTTSTLLCSVSLACNSSTTATGTCTASGTAAANDVLSFRATAPAGNTSAAQSTLTCSYTQ